MFERINAVMVKEVRQLARDRLTFAMIVGIPLMQMLLFGYAINFDVRDLRAAVVDEAGTSLSRALVADLQASGIVEIVAPSAGGADLRRRMSASDISVGVYIPPEFVVYWFTMSAQLKLWMDRCLAFGAYGKEPFEGKRIALAMIYGGEDPFDSGCVNALRTFQDAYNYVGAKIVGMVYGSAMEPGDIKANKALLKEAKALGTKLACRND